MKRIIKLLLPFVLWLLVLFQQKVNAQDTSKNGKELKNTIHFNLTNPIIFGSRSLVFGYERVLSKHRTFSVNIGGNGFPSFNILDTDSLKLNKATEQKGFNFSVDYRFYLAKENKYNAPHGVYIGPYYSFNYFEKKHTWSVTSTSGTVYPNVETKTNLGVNTIGFEMGYQFILWNRLSVDMILAAPGIAAYKLKASLGTNLSEEDKAKFFEKINTALADKFPGYSWAIDEKEFESKGSANTTSFGFRYMIQVGFRF